MTIHRLDEPSDSRPGPRPTSREADGSLPGLRIARTLPARDRSDRWFHRFRKRKRSLQGAAVLRWLKLSYSRTNGELASAVVAGRAYRQWIRVEMAFLALAVVSAIATLVLILGWPGHIAQKVSTGGFTGSCLAIAGGLQARRLRLESNSQ